MPHILVAGAVHPAGVRLLAATPGVTFDYVEDVTEASFVPLIAKADALVLRTQPLTPETVALAERLKIVSRHGVGYDAVHLPALNARGIALTIVGDVNSVSVAEHAMMLMLAAAKRAIRGDRAVRTGPWDWRNSFEAGEVSGKRLLILGYGRIGRHLARMAAGFNMAVRAYDPFLSRQGWPAGPVASFSDLADGLDWADVVSIHAPKADRPLLGAAELARLRPGAMVINTARGGMIDEAALVAALQEGRIAAAGLDVFADEPPLPDTPLFAFDQVIVSPHIAGLTVESAERMALSSVQNVLDYFDGTIDPTLVVNGEHLKGA